MSGSAELQARAAALLTSGLGANATAGVISGAEVAGGAVIDVYNRNLGDLLNDRAANAAAFQPGAGQAITFPSDLLGSKLDKQFYISFRFEQYQKRSLSQQAFKEYRGGLRLPVPNNLRDDHSADYSTPELGSFFGAATDAVARSTGTAGALTSEQLSSTLREGGSQIAGAAAASLLNRYAPEQLRNAFSAVSGLALNPFQTVLYRSPRFKRHSFMWKLIPRNAAESDILRQAVQMFQYHMLPDISRSSGVLFTFPSMVQINLMPVDSYLYKFKPAVVTDCRVNYAPASGPSFYKQTAAPTAIDLSIDCLEIEFWTKRDMMNKGSL